MWVTADCSAMANARRVILSRKSSLATGISTRSISRIAATRASLFPASNAAEKESINYLYPVAVIKEPSFKQLREDSYCKTKIN